mmetsp:Transcript_96783/g.172157  ORF Transcript_96783/g.172157 Transcript_96783/m.172157 type:complete len:476 (+) Transcript_96783:101-1528(+)|eukprot:CAMPEP_0197629084 /NCGR_PEP_ID=MMETSP1338-20131121/7091_1 /TAXON_ID=43686 ORGANISM="Pelagodinium beii, Strain RCC1491" /NCGR_SAMPLE_ID=MMETSP1338 /ASSEMBLY_ACC=CAM_ASM_000754 /LENGTH=475 /DNA_ID=CAMNT_0043200091 /DNA_START=90 /DNA_END=1517 /DNA_ORIENTATION=+
MKFGKMLLALTDSEYSGRYVNYKALKKLLRKQSTDCPPDTPVRSCTPCDGVSTGRCDCDDVLFMVELNRQIAKLNMIVVQRATQPMTFSEFENLDAFVDLNALAIQKAAKKFQKICGPRKDLDTMLANLEHQPFIKALNAARGILEASEHGNLRCGCEASSKEDKSNGVEHCINPVSPPCTQLSSIEHDIDDPTSPTSTTSHLTQWNLPWETLIIFDWDDTLFPTSALQDVPDPANQLPQFCKTLKMVLQCAACVGQIVIVTLATEAWFSQTMSSCIPEWKDFLAELGIKVLFARQYLQEERRRPEARLAPIKFRTEDEEPEKGEYLTKGKLRAMSDALQDFYGLRSWKNIISIGDSDLERNAITELSMRHSQSDRSGQEKRFRLKIVKFLCEPSIDELTTELQALHSLLFQVAQHNEDLFFDMSAIEDTMLGCDNDFLDNDGCFDRLVSDPFTVQTEAQEPGVQQFEMPPLPKF